MTDEILNAVPEITTLRVGLLHLALQHTSASLSLNENADATVRSDLQAFMQRLVPENTPYFKHTYEGSDDMPAHVMASLIGTNLTIPISKGRLALGTWQGIYLGEHRYHGGRRKVVITLNGE